MTSQDLSTLSYLARAVAADPEQADEYVAALNGDVDGTPVGGRNSAKLQRAVSALADEWRKRKEVQQLEQRDGLTLRDVLAIADVLAKRPLKEERLAGAALQSAAVDLLSRRRRELELTDEHRKLLRELPGLAPAADLSR